MLFFQVLLLFSLNRQNAFELVYRINCKLFLLAFLKKNISEWIINFSARDLVCLRTCLCFCYEFRNKVSCLRKETWKSGRGLFNTVVYQAGYNMSLGCISEHQIPGAVPSAQEAALKQYAKSCRSPVAPVPIHRGSTRDQVDLLHTCSQPLTVTSTRDCPQVAFLAKQSARLLWSDWSLRLWLSGEVNWWPSHGQLWCLSWVARNREKNHFLK